METQDVGAWGESVARKFLEEHGFVILETNWHCSHKEVDIIAQEGNTIVFVEVKTRTTTFSSPVDAVNKQKQKFLFYAADSYVKKKQLDCDIRFDIVSIVALKGNIKLEHISNAFYPSVK